MSKTRKYILIFIAVLLLFALFLGLIYLINTSKNKIKFKDIKESNNKITESFEVVLNGKKKEIAIEFTINEKELFNSYILDGVFANYYVSSNQYSLDNAKDKILNADNIKDIFNINNFKIIKGKDKKEYLMVIANSITDNIIYIFNDNLENIATNLDDDYGRSRTIDGYGIQDGFMLTTFYNTPCDKSLDNIWYKNIFDIKNKTDFAFKIENNKIYYLAFKSKNDANNSLEERVYTINNNELTYSVLNTYSVNDICGQAS